MSRALTPKQHTEFCINIIFCLLIQFKLISFHFPKLYKKINNTAKLSIVANTSQSKLASWSMHFLYLNRTETTKMSQFKLIHFSATTT